MAYHIILSNAALAHFWSVLTVVWILSVIEAAYVMLRYMVGLEIHDEGW
jgi:hypothetical protein